MVFEVVSDSCNNSLLCGPWNMIMIIPWKLNLASFDLSANTKSNYISCFTASLKVSKLKSEIYVLDYYFGNPFNTAESILWAKALKQIRSNEIKKSEKCQFIFSTTKNKIMTSTFIQNGTLENYTQSKWYETSVWNIHIKTFINDLLELPKRP